MNAMCQYFQNISQVLNLSLCVIQMQSTDCNIRLQSDCGDCSLIVEIAVWLLRLQSDCWDCSLIAEIAKVPQLTYTVGQSHGVSVTAISTIQLQSLQSNCNLHNQTAKSSSTYIYTWSSHGVSVRLQSQQSDCNLSNPTAISAIQLQSPRSDCK